MSESRHLIHLNGNLLCCIDTETTGLDPRKHEIWQVCFLPLDSFFKPCKDIMHFELILKLNKPENVDPKAMSREEFVNCQLKGVDQETAADMLEAWFNRLNLPENKRISPLAQNWAFDRDFLIEWLGRLRFQHIVDGRYRDLMTCSLYENDRADARIEQVPYPKNSLGSIATRLCVENPNAHDALNDCMVTAECYRKMVIGNTPL